ncbi:MAG: sugar transferase [Paracoccaceae bacterium]|jgi:lipopolysaccharide/colanic/teichoic acid biosynthesis glycosyltransferase
MKDFVHAGEFVLSAGFKDTDVERRGSPALALPWTWSPVSDLSAANINASTFILSAPDSSLTAPVSHARPVRGVYASVGKRLLDLTLIFLALPVVLLVIAICTLALWIEGGSPFYWQDRIGQGGKRFRIVKLCTMVREADDMLASLLKRDPAMRHEWEATQKLKEDPRITRVGAFLRRTSLDELPQLWNVLCGEMSLVGPRPMMPEQMPLYGDPKYYQAVKPGITGIWQVSARNESRFDYRQKTDRRYYALLSFRQDVKLLFQTIGVVLRGTGY